MGTLEDVSGWGGGQWSGWELTIVGGLATGSWIGLVVVGD